MGAALTVSLIQGLSAARHGWSHAMASRSVRVEMKGATKYWEYNAVKTVEKYLSSGQKAEGSVPPV